MTDNRNNPTTKAGHRRLAAAIGGQRGLCAWIRNVPPTAPGYQSIVYEAARRAAHHAIVALGR